jgi:hypothetical protein
MELRITLFLAFTGIVLLGNTLALWLAFKGFSNMTTKVTEGMREFQASEETRAWIRTLQAASEQAMTVTATVKKQVTDFEPTLAQAQTMFEFGLAKVDAEFGRICETVSVHAEKTQNAIAGPAEKIGAAASHIQGMLQVGRFLSAGSASDASSTPSE